MSNDGVLLVLGSTTGTTAQSFPVHLYLLILPSSSSFFGYCLSSPLGLDTLPFPDQAMSKVLEFAARSYIY